MSPYFTNDKKKNRLLAGCLPQYRKRARFTLQNLLLRESSFLLIFSLLKNQDTHDKMASHVRQSEVGSL